MLKDAHNDPIKRTAAITDVIKSIAIIPDEIARMVYAKECSTLFGMDEQTILRQIKHYRGQFIEQWRKERQQQQAREQRMAGQQQDTPPPPAPPVPDELLPQTEVPVAPAPSHATKPARTMNDLTRQEREVIRLIVNYGMRYLNDTQHDDGSLRPTTVLEYINNELTLDNMSFSDPLYKRVFDISMQYIEPYYRDLEAFNRDLDIEIQQFISEKMASQDEQPDGMDSAALIAAHERMEMSVNAEAEVKRLHEQQQFSSDYLLKMLCSLDEDAVRQLACDLAADNLPQLSKIHTQYAVIIEERDKLVTLVPERIYNWKNALLVLKINEAKQQIAQASPEQLPALIEYLQQLYQVRHELARRIGDRVVNPK